MINTRKGAAPHTDHAPFREGQDHMIVLSGERTTPIAAHGSRPADKNTRECPACRGDDETCEHCDGSGAVADERYDVIRLQSGNGDTPMIS